MARSMERQVESGRERERDLVLAFQSGNSAAYESIDRSCRPVAERICRRLLINPADVEEAVQETMMRAYQGLPRFNGSYALTAWIARIATNVCLDTLRSRSRRPVNVGAIEPNMEANGHDGNGHHLEPEELLEQAADAEDVRQVLSALPDRYRTALVLREFEGFSHRKIAEMLDTSPARVKALIHRAKAGFRRAWSDEHPGRLAAFAPLLTPINWVRKLFGRAPELDHPVAATAAQAAASPAAQSVVTIATERVSVLATVMLAGTVGFAVQHAPRESRVEEQLIVVEAAEAVVEPQEAQPAPEPKKKRERPKPEPAAEEPLPAVEASPAAEEVEEVVLEEPRGSTKPAVVTSPSPAPPPHPSGFTYTFSSDKTATEPCGCGGSPSPFQSGISVSETGFSSYEGGLSGAISDSTGQAAWPAEIRIGAGSARLNLSFEIRTRYGTSPYNASAVLTNTAREPWGGWTHTYSGTYQWGGGPGEHVDVPQKGSFSASLTFSWVEQRLVSLRVSLTETA